MRGSVAHYFAARNWLGLQSDFRVRVSGTVVVIGVVSVSSELVLASAFGLEAVLPLRFGVGLGLCCLL